MDRNRESELVARAEEAEREDRSRHAAFLYEQARRIALDRRELPRAYQLGRKAAANWGSAGDGERFLALLLELLTDIPPHVDPVDICEVRKARFFYYLEVSVPNLLTIEAERVAVAAACEELSPEGNNAPYFEGLVLHSRGRHDEAYECFEIAYSRGHSGIVAMDGHGIASRAALTAIKLDQFDAADRWIDKISSHYWPLSARLHRNARRLQVALRLADADASRTALLDLDNMMAGVQRPRYAAQVAAMAVEALCLDASLGDPAGNSHPATRRLGDFPSVERRSPVGQFYWTRTVLEHRLAALRYAAGMPPDEDYYGRPPHVDPADYPVLLPAELPARVTTAREAHEHAATAAARLDTALECDWRQQETANLRGRIEEIARTHGVSRSSEQAS